MDKYEVKYNDVQFKPTKYKKFMAGYPNLILACVSKEISKDETLEVIRL
ncbi:hypothetical protein [Pedobacter psychroterrae]|nr:hypothetical protein [Pedobacter psychroterrae]